MFSKMLNICVRYIRTRPEMSNKSRTLSKGISVVQRRFAIDIRMYVFRCLYASVYCTFCTGAYIGFVSSSVTISIIYCQYWRSLMLGLVVSTSMTTWVVNGRKTFQTFPNRRLHPCKGPLNSRNLGFTYGLV